MWYPENKNELENLLNLYLKKPKIKPDKLNGIIVPHAGYEYSGEIAGKAFSLIEDEKIKKAIIIGPSHYMYLDNIITSNREYWKTPLGKIKLFNAGFPKGNIDQEHSITNQIPFLQKIGIKEIMLLMVGRITNKKALETAEKIADINAIYIFSTDLSHFLPYDKAREKDKQTINIIENLDFEKFNQIDACGIYPLLILFHLCKIKKTKPKLIQYKNSGDVTGDKTKVVGYACFYF